MNRERLRRIRNYQSDDWYAALFVRPICIGVMLVIADWPFVTPNRLTTLATLSKLAGAALILPADPAARIGGVLLLQLGLLFDHLDGTVARYRGTSSSFGAFYDKTADAVSWFFVCAAVGWLAYRQSGDGLDIALALGSAYALLVRGYMKWIAAAEQNRLRWFQARRAPERVIAAETRPPPVSEPPARSAGDWARWLAVSFAQIYRFEEVDLFFWVGLFVLVDRPVALVWLLAVSQGIGMAGMVVRRGIEVWRVDRALQRFRDGRDSGAGPAR